MGVVRGFGVAGDGWTDLAAHAIKIALEDQLCGHGIEMLACATAAEAAGQEPFLRIERRKSLLGRANEDARRSREEADAQGPAELQLACTLPNTVVLCISADLPFAQARFCGAEGLDNVVTLSTLRGSEFIEAYGVAIASGPLVGLTARAVVVLDENDNVIHSELVSEIKNEPDYAAALAAL